MQSYTADTNLADIKILAVDMDLTLLADDNTMPEDMDELIDELTQAGVLFCAASGRPGQRLFSMFPKHLDQMAFCADNGAALYYKGERIYESDIEPERYRPVLLDATQRGGCAAVLCGYDGGYVLEQSRHLDKDFQKYYPQLFYIDSFEGLEVGANKFSLLFPNWDAEPLFASYYEPAYGKDFYVTNAGREWIDFMNTGTSKGSGVTHLARVFGVDLADVAACGDTYNDIPMLEVVGHSFVMGNAEEHMHAHAKYLLPSNNERGVATLARAILDAKS